MKKQTKASARKRKRGARTDSPDAPTAVVLHNSLKQAGSTKKLASKKHKTRKLRNRNQRVFEELFKLLKTVYQNTAWVWNVLVGIAK